MVIKAGTKDYPSNLRRQNIPKVRSFGVTLFDNLTPVQNDAINRKNGRVYTANMHSQKLTNC